jgi:hypothetical protein
MNHGLRARELARFARQGFLVVPGLADAAEVELLRALHHATFARPERRPGEMLLGDRDADGALNFERIAGRFAELDGTHFRERGAALLAAVLGEVPEIVLPLFIRKPARSRATPWHQHTASPRPPGTRADATLWMALEPVDGANACLTMAPGSQITPFDHDSFGIPDDLLAKVHWVECVLPAGDALLIHEAVAHGSTANLAGSDRLAVALYGMVGAELPS